MKKVAEKVNIFTCMHKFVMVACPLATSTHTQDKSNEKARESGRENLGVSFAMREGNT